MSTIGRLFGRSPFHLIQRHMDQVAKCVERMDAALDAFTEGSFDGLEALAADVSEMEHQADQIKDDVRNHLLRRVFMPIDRSHVLEILSYQDTLADTAEDVCVLLTMKQLAIPPELAEDFANFRALNLKAFRLAESIISELDELVETGFGGAEAAKVHSMANDVALSEHQVDMVQRSLLAKIYSMDDRMSVGEFHLWMRLTQTLATLSNTAENLAHRVLLTLTR